MERMLHILISQYFRLNNFVYAKKIISFMFRLKL